MKTKVAMCFSRSLEEGCFIDQIGAKKPVYLRFFEFGCQEGWEMYVSSKKTYRRGGVFEGAWHFNDGKFSLIKETLKIDLVYDRVTGLSFPPQGDRLLIVNRPDFKKLCYDKWSTYQKLSRFMPKTVWVGDKTGLGKALDQITTERVVLKPYNGMKGLGVYIGPKEEAKSFKFDAGYQQYIAQEFAETKAGVNGITSGRHDLRVVIANGQVVWCHVRTPAEGMLKANVAQGGDIKELDYESQFPTSIKKIVEQIAPDFYRDYDNPIYSIDFGMAENGPVIFEINDQIGFPLWEMKSRDNFLKAHISNFASKLKNRDANRRI